MQKMITQFEHKVGEKLYHFVCDPDSPIEHVKESLFQFMKYVGAIEDAIRAQQAKDAADKAKAAEAQNPQPQSEAA